MESKSNLLVAGIVVLALVIGYTAFLHIQKLNIDEDKAIVEADITKMNKQILKYESQDLLGAINAKETLSSFEGNLIKWSGIISKVRKTIPKNEDGEALVEILSYSGSAGRKISMNVRTLPGSADSYFDVAEVIEVFDDSPFFYDSFVPSISASKNEEGQEALTFLLTTTYVEGDGLEEFVGEPEVAR